jgi:hypothetical protein
VNIARSHPTQVLHPANWRVLAHALLALLVLLAQQGAWRHHLSHWAPAQASISATARVTANHGQAFESLDAPCLQCLAFAAMADTLGSPSAHGLSLTLAHVCTAGPAHTPHPASTLLAYQSRAPPLA